MREPMTNSYNEGYDALDMGTTLAVAYLREHPSTTLPGLTERPDAQSSRRTLLVVDSACDMPQTWLDYHHVHVLSRRIKLAAGDIAETRDPSTLKRLHAQLGKLASLAYQTTPPKPVPLRDAMQKQIRKGTTGVLVLTMSAQRSPVFSHALAASQSLVLIHSKVRRALDPGSPALRAWVIDSGNALTGVGVLLAEAVRLREADHPAASIAAQLHDFRRTIQTIAAPGHLGYLSRSARLIEQAPIPIWKRKLAAWLNLVPVLHMQNDQVRVMTRARGQTSALEHVLRAVLGAVEQAPLATPLVALSYAGATETIEHHPLMQELRRQCTRLQITLSLSPMSLTGALMLGPGSISASFASRS